MNLIALFFIKNSKSIFIALTPKVLNGLKNVNARINNISIVISLLLNDEIIMLKL